MVAGLTLGEGKVASDRTRRFRGGGVVGVKALFQSISAAV